MLKYDNLVEKLDEQVESILPRQVIDLSRDDYGGFVSDGIADKCEYGAYAWTRVPARR